MGDGRQSGRVGQPVRQRQEKVKAQLNQDTMEWYVKEAWRLSLVATGGNGEFAAKHDG